MGKVFAGNLIKIAYNISPRYGIASFFPLLCYDSAFAISDTFFPHLFQMLLCRRLPSCDEYMMYGRIVAVYLPLPKGLVDLKSRIPLNLDKKYPFTSKIIHKHCYKIWFNSF